MKMQKHAEESYYTPTSPEAAAKWYTEQRAKNRTIYWDGIAKRMLSTTESDIRKLKVKDRSKLAQVYSEADIMRLLNSIWEPTPSAMGSTGRVITYRGQLYSLHEITAASPVWYKVRLVKALRKVGKRFTKGASFRIVKDTGRSFTSPNSHIVNISEGDLVHRAIDCETLSKKVPPHAPYTCGHSSDTFDLARKTGKFDFGIDHAAHTIAHELGHNFWNHRMTSELRAKYAPRVAKAPVKTKTVKKYQVYVQDRTRDLEDAGVGISISLQNKVAHEKFAEMYRLFIMEGKYTPFFTALFSDIKKAGPKKSFDLTPHSDKAQQLQDEDRKESPYLGDGKAKRMRKKAATRESASRWTTTFLRRLARANKNAAKSTLFFGP